MTQAHTHNPVAVPSLRLVPADPHDPVRTTPGAPESAPSVNAPSSPPPASPEPQAPSPPPQSPKPASPQALPSLERLLSLYIDPNLSLADIAFTLGLSITETLLLTTEKRFKTILAFYSEAHEQRAEFLAHCNIDKATRTFVRLVDSTDKPETARKAAGAIVRLQQDSKPQKITPELQLQAATTLLHYRPPPRDDPPMSEKYRTNNSPQRAAERRKPVGRGASPG